MEKHIKTYEKAYKIIQKHMNSYENHIKPYEIHIKSCENHTKSYVLILIFLKLVTGQLRAISGRTFEFPVEPSNFRSNIRISGRTSEFLVESSTFRSNVRKHEHEK